MKSLNFFLSCFLLIGISTQAFSQAFNTQVALSPNHTYSTRSTQKATVKSGNYVYTVGTLTEKTSPYRSDISLTKFDLAGNVLWSRVYGQPGEDEQAAGMIKAENNGDLIIVGTTKHSSGDNDAIAMRIRRSNGALVWSNSYGNSSLLEGAEALTSVSAGTNEYIVAGWVFKPLGGDSRSKTLSLKLTDQAAAFGSTPILQVLHWKVRDPEISFQHQEETF